MQEIITAHGHKNVRSEHRMTVEVTKHPELGINGDCIIAVGADKACADLSEAFKEMLRSDTALLRATIRAGGLEDTITAWGSAGLILAHEEDMVIRKSDHICPRTLAIGADKASSELDRRLVEKLRDPLEKATILLRIEKGTKKEAPPLTCLERT